jgi:hypothetical protein
MAKKPAKAAVVEELPPAMDYAQHNATYEGFMGMLKWGIISAIVVVLALYAFIEGHQPLIGGLLLLLLPVGAIVLMVTKTRRT